MPFTYLITPPSSQDKGIIAFTVRDNVITGYLGEPNGRMVNFDYCSLDYIKHSKKSVSSAQKEDMDHKVMHSNDAETEVSHWHLRHAKKITPALLTDFLKQLQRCNEIKEYEGAKTYITKALIKDITSRFAQSLEQNSSTNYVYSNNLYYTQLPDSIPPPTIAEHAMCTYYMLEGCVPGNKYNPPQIAATYSMFNFPNAVKAATLGTAIVSGLAVLYGIFTLCRKHEDDEDATPVHQSRKLLK